jgi:post-segregation antitoxin (ccd killing protein)
MSVVAGKPVKAFLYQDHESHITVHMAFLSDPQTAAMLGQNPQAQAMLGALQAHIAEHYGMMYRKQIEDAAGVPYPEPDAPMDKDTELNISRLAAAAAQQVLQKKQEAAQQQQNAQTTQDPIVQMQQEELKIKQQEMQIKEKKLLIDAAAKDDQLDIERERIASAERIAGLQVGAKIGGGKEALAAKQESEGLKMGVDIARDLTNRSQQQAPTNRAEKEPK